MFAVHVQSVSPQQLNWKHKETVKSCFKRCLFSYFLSSSPI